MGVLRFLILTACLLAAGPATAKKHALLIGNSAYKHSNPLTGPRSDVEAMRKALHSLGYLVTVKQNLDERAMGQALLDFRDAAAGADTALVYYSGHGMEISGQNYLIPIDASLRRPGTERIEAVPLSLAIEATVGARRLSVVIIDACRNGAPGAKRSGVSKGFRAVSARSGLALAFSTAPGEPAWDGSGSLSPYTRALTEAIAADADLDVRLLLTSLGGETERYAGARQEPFARFGRMPRKKSLSLSGKSVATLSRPAPPPAKSRFADDLIDLGAEAVTAQRKGEAGKLHSLAGNFYFGRSGKPQDYSAAARLYREACALRHAEGCTYLGFLYDEGRGVKQDPKKAASLYRQGCDGGNALGCTNLGSLYDVGRAVKQDLKKAVSLYRQGCDGGNARGCAYLGEMYESGKGVAKSRKQAVRLYRKALKLEADNDYAKKQLKRLGLSR